MNWQKQGYLVELFVRLSKKKYRIVESAMRETIRTGSEFKLEQNSHLVLDGCVSVQDKIHTAKTQIYCFSADFSCCFLEIEKVSKSSILNVSS